MKNIIKKIVIVLVIIVICIPIINEMVENRTIKEITYKTYESVVDESKNYNFALVYIGNNDKDYKKEISSLIRSNKPVDKTESKAYYMDVEKLTDEQILELTYKEKIEDAYLFISNSDVIKIVTEKLDNDKLEAYIKEFVSLGVDKSIQAYKIPETAEEYIDVMNSDTVAMAVFGRDTCFYCNKFKIIYNTLAEENDLNIYYFSSESSKNHVNSKAYPSQEYKKLMALDITVPASCSSTKKDADISKGFSTPFTIFTKNGVVLDTICGFASKEMLIEKMQSVGMIEK